MIANRLDEQGDREIVRRYEEKIAHSEKLRFNRHYQKRVVDLEKKIPVNITTTAKLTCPHCRFTEEISMPTNACIIAHDCQNCGTKITPKKGDCCIFCSYGDIPCPPTQEEIADRVNHGYL